MEATVDWETALQLGVELPEDLREHLHQQALVLQGQREQMAPYFMIYSIRPSDREEAAELVVSVSTDRGELLVMQLHPAAEGRIILETHLFTVQEEVRPMMQLVDHKTLFLGEPAEPKQRR